MARDALIGHTGFVGGTLCGQRPFAATFNSRNIEDISGQQFDTVVCAGVSAVKWLANKEPEQDWQGISRLIDCLRQVEARHFVLISTVDVYSRPVGLTEEDRPETAGLHPYGLHRLQFEDFIADRYPSHAIVRLPALFGARLKKNAIYDLIFLNQTDKIPANGRFQWYPTRRLADDLDRITAAGVTLINVTAEPVEMETIRARFFPGVAIGQPLDTPPLYDLRSIHDELLGGHGGYHLSADAVLDELASYLSEARAGA
jgi:dTDP-4-dehydrorhamnose reductase